MHREEPNGPLPLWHELSVVWVGGLAVEHPLIRLVCALAKLHRKRRWARRPLVADRRRRALLDEIDLWVATNVGAAVVPPVAALIEEMARAGTRARRLLATDDPAGEAVHMAWTSLAALADQWSELVAHAHVPYEYSIAEAR
ncbi:hypothetical protein ACFVVM_32445 [Nocardia sp. NPDC058176]|uniref:hypothetical protein n=1 Tax=Nocardia sp. NPDC058176 TaxID=3346368 RepID=UPI0036D95A8F